MIHVHDLYFACPDCGRTVRLVPSLHPGPGPLAGVRVGQHLAHESTNAAPKGCRTWRTVTPSDFLKLAVSMHKKLHDDKHVSWKEPERDPQQFAFARAELGTPATEKEAADDQAVAELIENGAVTFTPPQAEGSEPPPAEPPPVRHIPPMVNFTVRWVPPPGEAN